MRHYLPGVLAASAVLCAGCMTQAEHAARMRQEIDKMIAVYGPACERLGYKNDSDQWRSCVLRLDAKDNPPRYSAAPTTTTCSGHRGFFNCTTF